MLSIFRRLLSRRCEPITVVLGTDAELAVQVRDAVRELRYRSGMTEAEAYERLEMRFGFEARTLRWLVDTYCNEATPADPQTVTYPTDIRAFGRILGLEQ